MRHGRVSACPGGSVVRGVGSFVLPPGTALDGVVQLGPSSEDLGFFVRVIVARCVRVLKIPPGSSCSSPAAVRDAALANLARPSDVLAGGAESPHVLGHVWTREGRVMSERAAG